MHGPLAGRAEITADFSKGAGELVVAYLRQEVKKTCFLIDAGPVGVGCREGDVHGDDAGQGHVLQSCCARQKGSNCWCLATELTAVSNLKMQTCNGTTW